MPVPARPGRGARRRPGRPREGRHGIRATAATTSGTPRSTSSRSSPTRRRSGRGTRSGCATSCCPPPAGAPASSTRHGALFPWRTINGEEASAYYAAGTAQYHINADVSFALAKYVRATGDTEFLYREGIDIAVETARLWATLGFWRTHESDGEESFHIHGVTGPDEYTTVVNDNLFTNVMARFNLRFAARTRARDGRGRSGGLPADGRPPRPRPGRARGVGAGRRGDAHPVQPGPRHPPAGRACSSSARSGISSTRPPDQRPLLLHFHPLVIYRYQVLKQADVVLALFLQGNHFSAEDKLADFEYYDPLTTGDSTLSAVVQSILAAEVGYQDLALEYFRQSIFVDLARPAPQRRRTACTWPRQAACGRRSSRGFGGMRDHFGELSFDPRLPADWPELSYTAALARHAAARSPSHAMSCASRAGEGDPLVVQRARRGVRRSARGRGGRRAARRPGPGHPGPAVAPAVRRRPPRGRHAAVGIRAHRDLDDPDHRRRGGCRARRGRLMAAISLGSMSEPRRRLGA